MDEIYRMLGAGHEADLAREARKVRCAEDVRRARRSARDARREPKRGAPRLFEFVVRFARPGLS